MRMVLIVLRKTTKKPDTPKANCPLFNIIDAIIPPLDLTSMATLHADQETQNGSHIRRHLRLLFELPEGDPGDVLGSYKGNVDIWNASRLVLIAKNNLT